MARPAVKTNPKWLRASHIVAQRIKGMGLQQIADDVGLTAGRIHQILAETISVRYPAENIDDVRAVELARLDTLLVAIWPLALSGDIAAIDRVLAIMVRRAKLLGADVAPARVLQADMPEDMVRTVRVEIVGDPEIKRLRWLEERERQLRLIEHSGTPRTATDNLQ